MVTFIYNNGTVILESKLSKPKKIKNSNVQIWAFEPCN